MADSSVDVVLVAGDDSVGPGGAAAGDGFDDGQDPPVLAVGRFGEF